MLKQMTRDFAYANNMAAADAAMKLGMAEGLKSGSAAGQQATAAMGATVGFGMAIGQNMGAQAAGGKKTDQSTSEDAPVSSDTTNKTE